MLLQEGENPENLRDLPGHTKTSSILDLYCHSPMEGNKESRFKTKLHGILFGGKK
nr:hypothetical protein [Desulfofundulus thermosubterraneus]